MADPLLGDRGAGVPRSFTDATAIAAEGARVGVVTCLTCGASILLDGRDDFDAPQLHADWHTKLENTLRNKAEAD